MPMRLSYGIVPVSAVENGCLTVKIKIVVGLVL